MSTKLRGRRDGTLSALIVTCLLVLLSVNFVECSPMPEFSVHSLLSNDPELDSESFTEHVFNKRNSWAIEEVQECRKPDEKVKKMKECKEEGKFAIQNECRVFLMCLKDHGKPVTTCCPEGLHFDHRLRSCSQTKEARCHNVCEKPGTRYPDPNNFHHYLECGDLGVPESKPCVDGCRYNADKQQCICEDNKEAANEYAEDHGLGQEAVNDILDGYEFPDQEAKNTTTTEQEGRSMSKTNGKKGGVCRPPTQEERDKMTSCPKEGQFPVKDECKLFRKCYKPGKEPIFTCCPSGLSFHHILRRCVVEDYAKCLHVCKEEGTKFPHPTNMRWFQMCTKNGELEEYKCKKKHWYDDTIKDCIKFSEDSDDKAGGSSNDTGSFSGSGTIRGTGVFAGKGTFKGNGTFYENGTFLGTGIFKGKGNFTGLGVFSGKWKKVSGWTELKKSEENFVDDKLSSNAGYTKVKDEEKDKGDMKVKNGKGEGNTMTKVDKSEGKQGGKGLVDKKEGGVGEVEEKKEEEEWEDEAGNRYFLYRPENDKKDEGKDDMWEDEHGRKFMKKEGNGGKGKKEG